MAIGTVTAQYPEHGVADGRAPVRVMPAYAYTLYASIPSRVHEVLLYFRTEGN